MKAFKFRFHSIDRVRKIALDQQRRVLSEAQAKVQSLESEKNEMLRLIELEVKRQRVATRVDTLPEVSKNFKRDLRAKVEQLEEAILQAKHEVFSQRKILEQRLKDKRVMEKLSEREKEKYDEELEKREAQDMDEVSVNLWTYRRLHS